MPSNQQDPMQLDSKTTHATEVQDAQAAADAICQTNRTGWNSQLDSTSDREQLRRLVERYGEDGILQMMSELT